MDIRITAQGIDNLDSYTAFVESLLRRIERRDAKLLREVIDMLHESRERIAFELTEAEGWNFYRLTELQRLTERWIRHFEYWLTQALADAQEVAYESGGDLAEEPLARMGYRVPLGDLSPYQLMIVQAYSADLIKGLANDAVSRINNALALGILSEKGTWEVMQDINGIIGEEGLEAVGGIAWRAERIARTELSRIMNMGTFARFRDAAKVIPGLEKEWSSVRWVGRTRGSPGTTGPWDHWNAHGQRVPVEEPFIVSGEPMMYPLDPAGSAGNVICCMCWMKMYHPSWEAGIGR